MIPGCAYVVPGAIWLRGQGRPRDDASVAGLTQDASCDGAAVMHTHDGLLVKEAGVSSPDPPASLMSAQPISGDQPFEAATEGVPVLTHEAEDVADGTDILRGNGGAGGQLQHAVCEPLRVRQARGRIGL